MKLYSIDTGYFKLDGGAMFGVVPKSIWNKINPADESNLCAWAMRSLLIEDGEKLILIDNGIGDKQSEKFFKHYYLHGEASLNSSLAANGFSPDDITDVILTHLHFDHCGGSIIKQNNKLVPAFKKAVYWSNEKHWNWAVYPNEREKASFLTENILPIRENGQLEFIQDGIKVDNNLPIQTFTKNISIRFVDGHTESMMLPQINYNGKTIVYMADLLPSHGHIPIPYVMAYDMFPLTTLNEKKSFLNEAVTNDYILFFEHDPIHECCNLHETDRGIRPKEFFTVRDL